MATNDATLEIVVKLRDLFTKEFSKLEQQIRKDSSKMATVMHRAFQTAGQALHYMAAPFKAVIGYALNLKTILISYLGTQVIGGMAATAAKAEDMERAFKNMARTIGADAVSALERMRKATQGMIPDAELMEKANTAIMLGAVKSADELENLAKYAVILGNAMGRSAKDSLESFTIGLARQSPMILDNLGLQIKLSEAYEAYARSIGVAVEALDEEQQKNAFRWYTWKLAEEKVKQLGGGITGLSVTFGQFGTAVEDVKVAISRGFAPVLATLAKQITEWVSGNRNAIRAWATEWGAVFNVVIQGLMATMKRVWGDWSLLWRLLKQGISTLWDYLFAFVEAKLDYFGGWLKSHVERLLRVVITDAVLMLGNIMSEIWLLKTPGEAIVKKYSRDYTAIQDEFDKQMQDWAAAEEQSLAQAGKKLETGWEKFLVMAMGEDKLADLRGQFAKAMATAQQIRAGIGETPTAGAMPARTARSVSQEVEETIGLFERLGAAVQSLGEGVRRGWAEFKTQFGDTLKNLQDATYGSLTALTAGVSDIFFDAMMGKMKSFRDYLQVFLQDIGRQISDFMAKQLVFQFFTELLPSVIGGVGGLFSTSPTLIDTRLGPSSFRNPTMALAQTGGITRGPTLAGEAGPEAVVPLPGNRKIPVELRGNEGRAVTVNFNISAVDGASVQRMLASQGRTISAIIQEALGRDQQLRAAVQAV